ncbi:hypothetical protein KGF54_002516 [Candida jiufengensis]|uniref:uncharacterized protein n=1 Tax=Candida jiufengensis TaxID=497108 RepID=UPI002224045F|nr:uncharacterized protein KGF54_002516 [Candida jiufengensis]KAI5953145.1 hypothetical protein KGF54_002516 [Candida jiufengensis]
MSSEFPIIQIKNLSYTTTNKQIFEFFSQFGTIYQIRSNSKQQGTIFIIYSNLQQAKLAIKQSNGVNLNGRYLISSLFVVDQSKIYEEGMKLRNEQLVELKRIYNID